MNAGGDSTLMRLPMPSIIDCTQGRDWGIGVVYIFLVCLVCIWMGGLALGRIRLTGISGWRLTFDSCKL